MSKFSIFAPSKNEETLAIRTPRGTVYDHGMHQGLRSQGPRTNRDPRTKDRSVGKYCPWAVGHIPVTSDAGGKLMMSRKLLKEALDFVAAEEGKLFVGNDNVC